jgi:hypothetical protein
MVDVGAEYIGRGPLPPAKVARRGAVFPELITVRRQPGDLVTNRVAKC